MIKESPHCFIGGIFFETEKGLVGGVGWHAHFLNYSPPLLHTISSISYIKIFIKILNSIWE